MPHFVFAAIDQVAIQPGSVISKVIHRDDAMM